MIFVIIACGQRGRDDGGLDSVARSRVGDGDGNEKPLALVIVVRYAPRTRTMMVDAADAL